CAACHKIMDPFGFSLESFDLTGKWRSTDGGSPVDTSAEMVDGTKLNGPESLREVLLSRQDAFLPTFTAKLMSFAVGRSAAYFDMPAIRTILRDAAAADHRFSSYAIGVVNSAPFQMRVAQQPGLPGAGSQAGKLSAEAK